MANDVGVGYVFDQGMVYVSGLQVSNEDLRRMYLAAWPRSPQINVTEVLNLDRSRKIKDLVSRNGMFMFSWDWSNCVCGTIARDEARLRNEPMTPMFDARAGWYREAQIMWQGLENLMGPGFRFETVENFTQALDRHIAQLEEHTVEDDHRGEQASQGCEDKAGVVEPAHRDHPTVQVRTPRDGGLVGPGRRAGPLGKGVGQVRWAPGEGVPGELVEVG